MSLNYSNWPTVQDVQDRLISAGLVLRDTTGRRVPAAIDEVVADVARRTLRQFVADTEDTTRTYDGTGTAEQEIDEIVSLTGVAIVGIQTAPGYTLTGVTVVSEQNKPQTRLVVARGSVPAFVSEGILVPYPSLFPAGRQNIQVTGKFGYAATIPHDLWNAVCGEVAHSLAAECVFDPEGRLKSWTQAGITESYQLPDADDLKWHSVYIAKTSPGPGGYCRPSGRRLRNLRTRMI